MDGASEDFLPGLFHAQRKVEIMPRMPNRGCAYGNCPRLAVPGSQYCEEHKKLMAQQYDRYERDPDVRKNYGWSWDRIRTRYVRSHPYCEKCFEEGRMTPVEEVHHIVPLSKGGTHDDSNLMSLCHSCHEKIHHRELGDR